MSKPQPSITADDFSSFDWQQIVAECEPKKVSAYKHRFIEKSKEYRDEAKYQESEVCALFGLVTSFMLDLDSPNQPFKPEWVWHDGRRSAAPDDIKPEAWNVLSSVLPNIKDCELRARVGDLLWLVRKGDYRVAQASVNAYLESAERLEDPAHWIDAAQRIERALQLSVQLGKTGELFSQTISHIETLLGKYNGEDPLFFSHRLMSLLLKHNQGDPKKYADLAGKAANRFAKTADWRLAREYLLLQAQWLAQNNNPEAEGQVRIKAAETFVKSAKSLLNTDQPNYLEAISEFESAVEALRQAHAPKALIKQVHADLLACQEISAEQMESVKFSTDVSELARNAQDYVKGKSLHHAILNIASMCVPTSVDDLRKQVEEQAKNAPLYFWIAARQLDDKGRVVAQRPPGFSEEPDEAEQVIRAEMYRQAQLHQGLIAESSILPALYQINSEHFIRLNDLARYLFNNQFIMPGRELLYARGILAGFQLDFMAAAHLLIPQLEHSIRYLLNQRGIVTSSIDSLGIQQEYDLGTLLYRPELEQIFSPSLIFDLQGLLINKFGSNLRNLLCHGLLDSNVFYSRQFIYLWGLCLYLCFYPSLIQRERQQKEEIHGEEETQDHE